jgi:hypothetical protein
MAQHEALVEAILLRVRQEPRTTFAQRHSKHLQSGLDSDLPNGFKEAMRPLATKGFTNVFI